MSSFINFLENELNEQQRQAVTQPDGAVMIIAGAGSGKTRVITARIAYLIIEKKIDHRSIVALTFTNKAAKEMKKRLALFLGSQAQLPFVGTFHSYCLTLLRSSIHLLPFSYFTIIDADDQRLLIKKILKNNALDKQITVSTMSHLISQAKSKSSFDLDEHFGKQVYKEVYHAYEAEKSASHALDFDDLLTQTLLLLKKNDQYKKQLQQRVRHLLVDEYQDTSMIQHALLKVIGLDDKGKNYLDSICVVGDTDQSIYSWRGAVVTNMLSFQQDFSPVRVIKIEQNYRSVQPILQAANAVIKNNKERHAKKLWSTKKADNRIMLVTCQSGYQEAEHIASLIKYLPKEQAQNQVAVVYRTHFQSRTIEETLIRSSIPYTIIGGIRFYERKEIKDLLAYLRLAINPYDRTSFFRIINRPTRGLGVRFEEMLYEHWQQNPLFDCKQLLNHLMNGSDATIKGTKAFAAKKFLASFATIDVNTHPEKALAQIVATTEYYSFLRTTLDAQEADTKIENIREFIDSAAHFCPTTIISDRNDKQQEPTLENFLHEIALLQEKMTQTGALTEHVQLMTLHAVKGLEFNTVIIAGLEEGLLPSSRSIHETSALEEERRLFYVGITRAKERLILLHAQERSSYGQLNEQCVSRFARELPETVVQHLKTTYMRNTKTDALFCNWLGVQPPANTIVTFGTQRRAIEIGKKRDAVLNAASSTQWRKNQPVIHSTFGTGIIQEIEKRGSNQYHLTVLFKRGKKKILSQFVQIV